MKADPGFILRVPTTRAISGRAVCLLAALGVNACGGGATVTAKSPELQAAIERGDDRSRCDFKGRTDREVIETKGPGSPHDNVRRVYHITTSGDDRKRTLTCREVDTNLDGVKDLYRRYDEKGLALEEEADADYDGKIDTWIRFSSGRILKVELDSDRNGTADEVRYYVRGKLSRVQRDTNGDSKPDVWEIYSAGRLERMGFDLDFDGFVDRWARDEVAHRLAEQKEREEEERAEREAAAKKAEEAADQSKPVEGYVSPRKR